MTYQQIKSQLFRLCQQAIEKRIDDLRVAITDAQEAANEETKSSSGDKYETGRAIAHLEIEKHSQQLGEALKTKSALERIPVDTTFSMAQPGSLVITDRGSFLIATGLGKLELAGETYYAIAPFSPLALSLAGAKAGDRITFRNDSYEILELA